MKRSLLRNILLLMVQALAAVYSQAQSSYAYTSVVNEVPKPGFYKIVLPPPVVARCKNGINDIRILDDKGRQVPYILKADPQQFVENNFIAFPVLSVTKETDKQTHVVITNTSTRTVSELLLVIRNTDADRTVTISGSDDNKQWFVIKENIQLSNIFNTGGDRFVQSLSFPASSYPYFKIIINGKDLLPVNIVKAGIYDFNAHQGNYLPVPGPVIVQKDSSDKSSYVSLRFSDNYQLDKLELEVAGARFYRRTFYITSGKDNVPAASGLVLRSGIAPAYPVNVKAGRLTLIIQNEDNPPLLVSSVKAYQLSRYLLAYLEPARRNRLVFGDSAAAAPRYDLNAFTDSIGNSAAVIATGAVVATGVLATAATPPVNPYRTIILWGVILLVLALLLVFTLRMMKEINNKERK